MSAVTDHPGRPARRSLRTDARHFALVSPIGTALLVAVVLFAIVGPWLAPHGPTETIGRPGQPPSGDAWLGTDFLGRDVLSRMCSGGRGLLLLSLIATVAAYAVGVSAGLIAGYLRGATDALVMRCVDLFMTLPGLLTLLVLIGSTGTNTPTLVVGTVLVVAPGVARLIRTATLEVSGRSYVEAAVARGETTGYVVRREIFPNIVPVVVADFGVRFSGIVMLIATLSYLGLGAKPPSSNWALMMAENRAILGTNMWSVIGPGIVLAALTVGVNFIGDAFVGRRGQSRAHS